MDALADVFLRCREKSFSPAISLRD